MGVKIKDQVKKESGKILVVDDDDLLRSVCVRELSHLGHVVSEAPSGETALQKLGMLKEIDLVLLDINMPGIDGMATLKRIKQTRPVYEVIMVTGSKDLDDARNALRLGAYDYLVKPIHLVDLTLAVSRALEKVRLTRENMAYQQDLERQLKIKTAELIENEHENQRLLFSIVVALAEAMEFRDKCTGEHAKRIAEHSTAIARYMGIGEDQAGEIFMAGILHDIGKLGVPDLILNKPGPLTKEERSIIQKHTEIGASIIENVYALEGVARIVRSHHERFDGKGYLMGLKGEAIPIGARILAVADTYDAMISSRPYQTSFSSSQSIQELKAMAGTQFDPAVVDAYIKYLENPESDLGKVSKYNHFDETISSLGLISKSFDSGLKTAGLV